jgi:cell division cycle protein 20 (cofactor of APC complex)
VYIYIYDISVTAYQVNHEQPPDDELTSPTQKETERVMSENLHGGDIKNMRILSYRSKAPGAPDVSLLFH